MRFGRVPESVRGYHVGYHRRLELRLPALLLPPGGDPDIDGRLETFGAYKAAARLDADMLYFDLCELGGEDGGWRPELGPVAVRMVADGIRDITFTDKILAVRLPPLRSMLFDDAVVHVIDKVGELVDAFILTDIEAADEVREISNVVRNAQRVAGRKNPIALEVEIGTPRSVLAMEAIAAIDDVSALVFDPMGLTRCLGCPLEDNTWIWDWHAVRGQVPVIAAAHGKEAVDAAPLSVAPRDGDDADLAAALEVVRGEADAAVRHGFAAKRVIDPLHVPVVSAAFTPMREEALDSLGRAVGYARSAASQIAGGRDFVNAYAALRQVRVALLARVLSDDDIARTGFALPELQRRVRAKAQGERTL